MELTNQSARLLKQEFGKTNEEIVDNAYKHAAGCAGICYASRKTYEHADEAKNFVNNVLIKKGHLSPLGHATCYVDVSYTDNAYECNELMQFLGDSDARKYANVIQFQDKLDAISLHGKSNISYHSDHVFMATNLRFIVEHNLMDIYKKNCVTEDYVMNHINPLLSDDEIISPRVSVLVETSRGISAEFNRHAANMVICERSTRYCNLSNTDKFADIEFMKSVYNTTSNQNLLIDDAYTFCEQTYCKLIEMGLKPEIARNVLSLGLKTECVYTADMTEWRHIFDLRMNGTTGRPHPDAQDLALDIYNAIYNDKLDN